MTTCSPTGKPSYGIFGAEFPLGRTSEYQRYIDAALHDKTHRTPQGAFCDEQPRNIHLVLEPVQMSALLRGYIPGSGTPEQTLANNLLQKRPSLFLWHARARQYFPSAKNALQALAILSSSSESNLLLNWTKVPRALNPTFLEERLTSTPRTRTLSALLSSAVVHQVASSTRAS